MSTELPLNPCPDLPSLGLKFEFGLSSSKEIVNLSEKPLALAAIVNIALWLAFSSPQPAIQPLSPWRLSPPAKAISGLSESSRFSFQAHHVTPARA